MEDNLILVDIFDRPVGTGLKQEVHVKGQLHRAFSVFICHDGKMLIHRRNRGKYHCGGLWTNACCSHPRAGETLEDAVDRRLMQELGIACETEEIFSFVYRAVFDNGITEHEYDHVFMADYTGDFHPDPEEIEEIRWIDYDTLAEELTFNADAYTPWFMTAASRILKEFVK